MHTFSMTCKAESVLDRLGDHDERQTAIRWFRDHFITKLYIESYRHGRLAPEQRLRIIGDEFSAAGFEVGGCITPTNLSKRNNNGLVSCYTDPDALDRLQEMVERTASVFDFFILDDFLFTSCTCDDCEAFRAGRPWALARCECMLRVGRERIIEPARAVNPGVRIILKYPLWYEQYLERGYDVIRDTELYDEVWIGSETRDPDSSEAGRRPQTAACWIQGWMNDIAGDKSGGGWYDPIDTSPLTYLEQARQTILGGARESLLHCYDYLGTDTPGVAVHGKDLEVTHGRADAEAFRREAVRLRSLANLLETMEPYGVLVPKDPSQPTLDHSELYLPGFIGMLGIPMRPAGSLRACDAAVLGMQAFGFDGLVDYIAAACESDRPLVLTQALRDALVAAGEKLPDALRPAAAEDSYAEHGEAGVIHCTDTLSLLRCPEDLWELTSLPPETLNDLRNRLLAPFGIEFSAPGKVSLHLFRSGAKYCEVVENFNDTSVSVRIRYISETASERVPLMALPEPTSASFQREEAGTYVLSLAPRSLLVLTTPGVSTVA